MPNRVIGPGEFLRLVDDALLLMGRPYDSPEALCLLTLTSWHESGGLRYVRQIRGPALTTYQMEPRTYERYMVAPVLSRDPRMIYLLRLMAHLEWIGEGGCLPDQIDEAMAMDAPSVAMVTTLAALENVGSAPPIESLVLGDDNQLHRAATIAARLVYWEATSRGIPHAGHGKGWWCSAKAGTQWNLVTDTLGHYWKSWYNTKHGKGRVEQFVHGAEEMRDMGACPISYVAENWRWDR